MKNKNYLPLYFAFAIVFGVLIGNYFNGGNSSNSLFAKKSSNEVKIKRLIDFIQRDYVDSVDTEDRKIRSAFNLYSKRKFTRNHRENAR